MRRSGSAVALLVLLTLLVGTSTALAQPTPPPNPSDDELRSSRDAVGQRAGEVGRLTARLVELDSRTDELQAALAAQRETAEAALTDLQAAQDAAAEAARLAEEARVETGAASVAIAEARARLDEFVTATYQQGVDTGPLGLLSDATSPADLVARAEFGELIARSQLAAQDSLERALVGKANADSVARAARDDAEDREAEAQDAKLAADEALAVADAAARAQAEQLAALAAEQDEVRGQLAAAESADSGLRDQRSRYTEWQRRVAEEQAARDRAERAAAAARVAAAEEAEAAAAAAAAAAQAERRRPDPAPAARGGPPAAGRDPGPPPVVRGGSAVQRVIDRAKSQIGVQYVWGGGNGRGPSTGIPDAFGSPLNRVGFDCSGLMVYAFRGAGVSLPRVSRNQYHAGRHVPIAQLRPGDMVFYRNGGAPIHHVALYIGGGRMIEAPYTGANVRVVPLRTRGLLPLATRVL